MCSKNSSTFRKKLKQLSNGLKPSSAACSETFGVSTYEMVYDFVVRYFRNICAFDV